MASLRGWLLVWLVAGCACRPAPQPEPAPASTQPAASASPAAPSRPTRFQVYRALLAASDLPLRQAAHCDSVIGEDAGPNPTLGDWISYNLSVLEDGSVALPVQCSPEGAGQRCCVDFSLRNDAENVLWRWGVAFKLGADLTLDRASVECTGAG